MHQVSLFDSSEDLLAILDKRVERLDWSYSKRNSFETCLRMYFYGYYAHALKNPYPNKDKVRFYKRMSNNYLISGEIVHLMIKNYLDRFQTRDELKWRADRLKSWSKKLIIDYLNYSFNYKKGSDDGIEYPPPLIQELFYDYENHLEIYEQVEKEVSTCIDNFFTDAGFQNLIAKAKKSTVLIEENINFRLEGKVRIKGKIDFAFESDNEFIICDWKTGEIEDAKESLQLLVYALWAILKKGYKVNQLRLMKGYLKHNKIEEYQFSDLQVARAKAAILQSAESMIEYSDFGEEGIEEAFTPVNLEKVCNLCSYKAHCQKTI